MTMLRGIRSPLIREVRGRGLFIAMELTVPARPFCEELLKKGLLCKETRRHVVRFAPPLVIKEEELAWAAERIAQAVAETEKTAAGAQPRTAVPEPAPAFGTGAGNKEA